METKGTIKELIVRRLLDFLGTYVSLSEAWCATLGGQGFEAHLWQEAGIQPKRGYLIERNARLCRPLIAQLPFEYYPRLESFARWWERNHAGVGLDLVHLDLCGTLEPILDTVRPLIPIVARSHGRCLAITVAEKRRNRSLDSYELVQARMTGVVGAGTLADLEDRLTREYERLGRMLDAAPNAKPEKSVKREVGLLWCLIQLATGIDGTFLLPDRIERYVYRSDYGRRSCRMRTTFLRIGQARPASEAAGALVNHWLESPLFVVRNGQVESLSPSIQVPAKRRRGRPNTRGVQVEKGTRKRTRQPSKNSGDPVIAVQLALLRAEAAGPQALQRALGVAASDLGVRPGTDRTRRILNALRSRMFGRFRPSFLRTAVIHTGGDILPELAALYSRLKGEPVTVETLQAEAGVASDQ